MSSFGLRPYSSPAGSHTGFEAWADTHDHPPHHITPLICEGVRSIMRIPGVGTNPPPLTCPMCAGAGRIVVSTAVVGKGWRTSGKRCRVCKGHGTLPKR